MQPGRGIHAFGPGFNNRDDKQQGSDKHGHEHLLGGLHQGSGLRDSGPEVLAGNERERHRIGKREYRERCPPESHRGLPRAPRAKFQQPFEEQATQDKRE